MAQIRHELHHDVQGAVRGAQALTDWRSMVGSHPWLALGIAAAAGYLIVPKRRRETPTFVTVEGAVGPDFPATNLMPAGPPRQPRWGALQTVYGMLAPVAVRAAQNYLLQHVEQWLAAHPLSPPQNPPGNENSGRFDRTTVDARRATGLYDE
jgi:hypothetical protein